MPLPPPWPCKGSDMTRRLGFSQQEPDFKHATEDVVRPVLIRLGSRRPEPMRGHPSWSQRRWAAESHGKLGRSLPKKHAVRMHARTWTADTPSISSVAFDGFGGLRPAGIVEGGAPLRAPGNGSTPTTA